MASEAQVRNSLSIRKGNVQYQSTKAAYIADVDGAKGPSPGAITATLEGTNVDFSQLVQPGLCEIINLDEENYVTVGIYDPETTKFYPMLDLLAGENIIVRITQFLAQEMGTGSGTVITGPTTNTIRIKAHGNDCAVFVGAFES